MGRLARRKSFFQETLEVRRGVFWRGLGGVRGGLRRLGRLGALRPEDPHPNPLPQGEGGRGGSGCGAGVQRVGGGEGRVGTERRGAPGRVIALCQGSSRGRPVAQGWPRGRRRRERWEGEHDSKEAKQELGEVEGERDSGHSGQGCGVYTVSVHWVSARGKVSRTGARGSEGKDGWGGLRRTVPVVAKTGGRAAWRWGSPGIGFWDLADSEGDGVAAEEGGVQAIVCEDLVAV